MTDHDMEQHGEDSHTTRRGDALLVRKHYYVAVGGGQILEDPEAAAYELEILANEHELGRLRELFEELEIWDGAQTFHFAGTPYTEFSTDRINLGYELLLKRVYEQLHELGTEETKRHIQSMRILDAKGDKEGLDA